MSDIQEFYSDSYSLEAFILDMLSKLHDYTITTAVKKRVKQWRDQGLITINGEVVDGEAVDDFDVQLPKPGDVIGIVGFPAIRRSGLDDPHGFDPPIDGLLRITGDLTNAVIALTERVQTLESELKDLKSDGFGDGSACT